MRIRKSRYIESYRTHCYTRKFNIAFSLCGVLEVTLYFSEGFLEAAARVSAVAKSTVALGSDHSLFLETKVQFVIFYTTIEAQIVFKMLLVLITGQITIAGQLKREVHL